MPCLHLSERNSVCKHLGVLGWRTGGPAGGGGGIVAGPDQGFLCAAMISFVNPDLLGNLATFKRVFAEPISKSRDRSATPEEQQLGQERSK